MCMPPLAERSFLYCYQVARMPPSLFPGSDQHALRECLLALVLRQMVLLRSEFQPLLGFVLQFAQFVEVSSRSSLLVFSSWPPSHP